MTRYFVLDSDGAARYIGDDPIGWARWFEQNSQRRQVAFTDVGDASVSTVFLGIDHQWGTGPPLIFETMIFGGQHDQYQRRWTTRPQALAGHDQVVAALRAEEEPGD